ncbi:DUF2254 domain-containing protein [Actinomycetospora sp. NBRC 106378]|uniref:DUF2254 domain-containing protein n=1 Tax=Actinomycetospora sp. NBRC 106378 TaxID=3032208 RepID=UPI0024A58D4A|nr:DUF2254 domain-containing protein [Actinomycetospora sp. NBRC 106378]GLZ53438.1 hypothetical protein Acsp07_30550 [Actinomycetospora sp. NBRC 106378]
MIPSTRHTSGRFWVVPAWCGGVAIVLAFALARLDRAIGDVDSAFLFPGPPEGARSFLGAVITAMISFTGLVFSITVVVLVLTSGQFSPRVLRQFLHDRTIQWSLGLFVASFLYAIFALREVVGTNGNDAFVPRISVTVAFLLVLVAVGQFVHYIHHVVHMIQASSIIVSIGEETRDLLESRHPVDAPPAAASPVLPDDGVPVTAEKPGLVVSVDRDAILRRAVGDDAVAVLAPRIGDFVPAGATLLTVHSRSGAPVEPEPYAGHIRTATERTMDQDLSFGLRQLVDVAIKALSPSINDPTTACQVLDVLHDLLRRVVTRPWPAVRLADDDGVTRVCIPSDDVGALLRIALNEIHHYGAESTQVPERITRLLDDLDDVALTEHREAVRHYRDRIGR